MILCGDGDASCAGWCREVHGGGAGGIELGCKGLFDIQG